MTQKEFDDIVKATCPHCAKGMIARQRHDTKEWVHYFTQPIGEKYAVSARQGHSLCLATHLRNSELAKGVIGG